MKDIGKWIGFLIKIFPSDHSHLISANFLALHSITVYFLKSQIFSPIWIILQFQCNYHYYNFFLFLHKTFSPCIYLSFYIAFQCFILNQQFVILRKVIHVDRNLYRTIQWSMIVTFSTINFTSAILHLYLSWDIVERINIRRYDSRIFYKYYLHLYLLLTCIQNDIVRYR